jgi:hypothetical protein
MLLEFAMRAGGGGGGAGMSPTWHGPKDPHQGGEAGIGPTWHGPKGLEIGSRSAPSFLVFYIYIHVYFIRSIINRKCYSETN